MSGLSIARPDITLILDLDGVIQKVDLAGAMEEKGIEAWIGRPWVDTVAEVGPELVRQMIDDARISGLSAFHQIRQRFPSGIELPIEYTTVRLGGTAGLIAIGKNLQTVAELQARLVAAQQAMERDYWKLREVETRYRVLFDVSNEPVLLVAASTLRISEANPAAVRALGASPVGRDIGGELAAEDRDAFHAMLSRTRDKGKAPGILVHFGRESRPWLIRASLISTIEGPAFMLQLAPVGGIDRPVPASEPLVLDELIDRIPEGFVVIDERGALLWTNQAFLDLVQAGARESVVGERLGRWVGRPGADVGVLLTSLRRYGTVRLFETTLAGTFGSEISVELSAAGIGEPEPRRIGVLVREAGQRFGASPRHLGIGASLDALARQVGTTPLRILVGDTVAAVERHYIEAALELTGGNRTAAANVLGLSRQSLYAKLGRYGFDVEPLTTLERTD